MRLSLPLALGIACFAANPSLAAESGTLDLRIGPIPGLTTDWHSAPESTSVPRGTRLALKVQVPPGTSVNWLGAQEKARDAGWSVAESPMLFLGNQRVEAEVLGVDGRVHRRGILFSVEELDPSSLQVFSVEANVSPVVLDEADLPATTHAAYLKGSIADLLEIAPGRFRTSVNRTIHLRARTDPDGLAPLLEWRVMRKRGVEALLGPEVQVSFGEPGYYQVWTGSDSSPKRLEFEVYRTQIVSHESGRDLLPQGVPVMFRAVTEPPGAEAQISWLASTSYGTATPIQGRGPTFTVRFDDTFSAAGQEWLGVRADNAIFGQDLKGQDRVPCASLFDAEVASGGLPLGTSQMQGDMIVSQDLELTRFNLFGTGVDSSAGATGPFTLTWDAEAGTTRTLHDGMVEFRFPVRVHYPLIDDRFGQSFDPPDAFFPFTETFEAKLAIPAAGSSVGFATLDLALAEPLVGAIGTFAFPPILICGAAKAAPCPQDRECKKKKLCLQPIVIAENNGANPTSCPSFDKAKTIWGKCCKDLEIKPDKMVNKMNLQKPTSNCVGLASQDELDLFKESSDDNEADNTCVEVYCINRFRDAAGVEKENCWGGAVTFGSGKITAKIIVQEDTDPTIVGHEIGHAVGLQHPVDASGNEKDDGTCMHPSGANRSPVSEKQSKSNCAKGVMGACRMKDPDEDCCKTWELDPP